MPRSHALQARPGSATGIHVRVPDTQLAQLERVARRSNPAVTVSELVREAITNQLMAASGRSAFFKVFARFVEDLQEVDVRPILVGAWAAAAHGYLTPTESFDLVIREKDIEQLRLFLKARGVRKVPPFPFRIGRSPWCVTLSRTFGGVVAEELPFETHAWDGGATSLDTLTLDALLTLGASELPDYTMDALAQLKAGTHHLDDGERGVVAWDAVGRFTASAAYPDPQARGPYKFIDFREVTPK